MPFLFPESTVLLKMFGINEAQMVSDVYEQFFGKRFITPKTYRNMRSGKHGPMRTFMQHVEFMNVDAERKKDAEKIVKKADSIRAASEIYKGDRISRAALSIINLEVFAESFRELGAFYVADVIGDIVKREKAFSGSRGWFKARAKVADDGLVNYILHADEVALIRQAKDNAHFSVSIALLWLRTPLYVVAALEAQHFTDFNIGVLDTSRQIADGEERAVGVFFTNLSKHLVKKDVEFVRKYMLDVDVKTGQNRKDPEGAAVKKFYRWQQGTSVPQFDDVLAIARKISENMEDVFRIMFLFLLAVYIRNGTVEILNRLNISWNGEYKRFLDDHMTAIKTKAG